MAKKRKQRVPRTRNARTMTEAQFFSMIRSALREKSRWWKPSGIVRVKARRPYKGPNKRQKYEYQCNKCSNTVEVIKDGSGTLVCCGEPMVKV